MTSGCGTCVEDEPHPGWSECPTQRRRQLASRVRTKPSMRPPWMSAFEASNECGPPTSITCASWNGRTQCPSRRSGTPLCSRKGRRLERRTDLGAVRRCGEQPGKRARPRRDGTPQGWRSRLALGSTRPLAGECHPRPAPREHRDLACQPDGSRPRLHPRSRGGSTGSPSSGVRRPARPGSGRHGNAMHGRRITSLVEHIRIWHCSIPPAASRRARRSLGCSCRSWFCRAASRSARRTCPSLRSRRRRTIRCRSGR